MQVDVLGQRMKRLASVPFKFWSPQRPKRFAQQAESSAESSGVFFDSDDEDGSEAQPKGKDRRGTTTPPADSAGHDSAAKRPGALRGKAVPQSAGKQEGNVTAPNPARNSSLTDLTSVPRYASKGRRLLVKESRCVVILSSCHLCVEPPSKLRLTIHLSTVPPTTICE